MMLSNEDVMKAIDPDQICYVEVSPVTAEMAKSDKLITFHVLVSDVNVNPVRHFLKGKASDLLDCPTDNIGIRWNSIYKMLIHDNALWFTKYQETYDYLKETLISNLCSVVDVAEKSKAYIGWRTDL